jgi:hypothetical protein
MDRLFFAIPPTMPDQDCCFFACQPPVTRLAFWRQRHAHDTSMKAFLGMVIDGRAKRLKVTTGPAYVAAVLDVTGTRLGIDLRQHLAAPVLVQAINPCLDLKLFRRLPNIREINCEHIRAVNLLDVSPLARGLIFLRNVFG